MPEMIPSKPGAQLADSKGDSGKSSFWAAGEPVSRIRHS
jgi:hypothetical protein